MKLYDAKEKQICLICGATFPHNKNGLFTSHLKQIHNIDHLHSYLKQHFYSEDDLKCQGYSCNGVVELRYGKPNKYCDKGCFKKKDRTKICEVCGKPFESIATYYRACSKECGRELARQSIKEWHANMTPEEKKERFTNIITKTAKTRRINGTPSWNSGKTGIYSEETIERIRETALKQFEEGSFKKTQIEEIMECILNEMNLNYTYSFILEKRQFDFILHGYNLLIECDGDYWHANPKFYPEPSDWQKERIEIDRLKNEIALQNGYHILRFWEDDIMNHVDQVEQIIASYLSQLATT